MMKTVVGGLMALARLAAFVFICIAAYNIRMHAVNTFGKVIHEFDPYFNFRATEYLVDNGWNKFITWYDEKTWYPLGRPVGTTIYPGLQFTAWFVYGFMNMIGMPMSVNDVCVFMPAWFSTITCIFIFGLTYECSKSANAGIAAAFIMAVLPAHLMRSVAGGYDNESIAIAAMCATFYFWVRSIKCEKSWPLGIITALAYTYMVAAWGGYVFVLNMIGLHAMALVFLGYFTPSVHKAYSLFYVFGTIGAIQWPVVGLTPLKSLEQLGPMFVFFVMQVMAVMEHRKRTVEESPRQFRMFQLKLLGAFGAMLAVVVAALAPTGYFGPLSSRVRGLFVQHTRTGNPLVDSVAEHQATRDEMYFHFFHCICYIAPFAVPSLFWKRSPAKYFTLVYGLISLYFSRKMNRLVLLLAPAAAILGGIAVAGVLDWCFSHYMMMVGAAKKSVLLEDEKTDTPNGKETAAPADSTAAPTSSSKKGKKDKKKGSGPAAAASSNSITEGFAPLKEIENTARKTYDSALYLRYIAAIVGAYYLYGRLSNFWDHSQQMAVRLSNPSIILAAQTQSGQQVMLDDFREAYWWIRDNTPEDARVMSWWDYGYQISQIANRTTLADGNTWNHEHIALLGKCLVSPVKESHKIVRHLADYVLVWSTRFVGNPGDDIAKSPHMARIGGSVYKDVKAQEFYIDRQGRPSKMMYESLVYNLVLNKFDPNVPPLPPDTYEEVHTSPNRMVRVYKVLRVSQQSKDYGAQNLGYKAWLAGTHLDDAYPPALQKILSKRQDFAQLEDFNAKAKK